jgi:uncharacterized protein YfbU (UPF0304 family)
MKKTLDEKIEVLKNKEKAHLMAKLETAREMYNDTGYDRYFKQIKRFEEQLESIDCKDVITVAEVHNIKVLHWNHLQDIQKKAEEFAKEEPLNIEFKHFCKWLDNYMDFIEKDCI